MSAAPAAAAGSRIVSARGVPGTVGAIALTLHDRRPVLLSTWHVLFGDGAEDDGEVSLVDGHRISPIGRALYGKLGTVHVDGEEAHVDCAVASCEGDSAMALRGYASARAGALVTKTGAATGTTRGIVVSVESSDTVSIDGRTFHTPRQIVVRPVDATPFSAEGDSGALIVDEEGKAVGLLWGINTRGESVASPIAPVLHAMNITL